MAIGSRLAAGFLAIACSAGFGAFNAAQAAAAGFSHAPGSPFVTPGAAALALGDLNGDARSDAVIADFAAGTLGIMLGGGRGTLAPAPVPPVATGGTKPSAVAIADFNEDGRPDVVAANDGSKNVSLLLGDGAGGLAAAAKSPFSTNGARPASVTVGDFNGDANLDVAVVHFSSGDVTLMLGDGQGGLARGPGGPTSASGSHPGPTAAGDFNADGKLDLAVANESGNVVVLAGDGAGRLSKAGASPFGFSPTGLGAGDFNVDGKLDVAIANATGTVSILLGNGAGGLSKLPAPIPVNRVGTAPSALVVADLDFDGKLDIAVTNAGSNNLSVLHGDGAGHFTAAPGTPVLTGGAGPAALALAEMNGDGKVDLVAVNAAGGSVAVLLNGVAPATFVSFPSGPAPGQQVTFAYSSTGAIDTLEWDLDGNGVFNDGQGPIATRVFAAPGSYAVSLRVTDLDGAVRTGTQTITVRTALAPLVAPTIVMPGSPVLMAPFPIVRVTGRTTSRGARIRELAVLAPSGAKVTVRCRGKGCPFRSWRRIVGRKSLVIKPLGGRFLRAGITLEVRVYKKNQIGKYTKLVVMKRRPPARSDRCLTPNSSRPTNCPST
jgi:VCBS repeat protein/PKD domain-containing protein/FG-GAP repeat protein